MKSVKEVIDYLEDVGHFTNADVFMEPPSDGEMTEGDSADEEEPTSFNNLSGRQLRAPAVVAIKEPDDTDNHSDVVDHDDAVGDRNQQNEVKVKEVNLGSKRKKIVSRQWHKEDINSQWPQFTITPKLFTGATDPVNCFEYFFDEEVCQYLASMSTKYALVDKGIHGIDITLSDVKCFLGILLLSGYLGVPRWRMLWEVSSETFNACVSNAMRRTQFENIKRFFHCSDNATLNTGDKFAKVRPLMAMLNDRYLSYASLEENLCVDESMAPYFGRHGAKQYIRGKPVRFGFKFWCLCDRLGYLVQFEPYQSGQYDKDIGLGASVVLDLISELPSDVPFKLFGDRFFTSLHLTDQLKTRDIGYTGTVMSNRTERCPVMEPKLLAKKPRGFYDHQLDKSTNSIVVGWNDNRPVYMASSVYGVDPIGSCVRWSASEKRKVAQPPSK